MSSLWVQPLHLAGPCLLPAREQAAASTFQALHCGAGSRGVLAGETQGGLGGEEVMGLRGWSGMAAGECGRGQPPCPVYG